MVKKSFLCCMLIMCFAGVAIAKTYKLESPKTAIISLGTATLYFEQLVIPASNEISIVIPEHAQNFAVEVQGRDIVSQRSEPCEIEDTSEYGKYVDDIVQERTKLTAKLNAIVTELSIWKSEPGPNTGIKELEWRLNNVGKAVEKLLIEKAKIDQRLHEIDNMDRIPDRKGKRIILSVKERKNVPVLGIRINYSYMLANCGWRPEYSFTADNNTVKALLKAKIRQFSGVDWENTKIVVSLGISGQVSPRPLPVWRLDLPQRETRNMKSAIAMDNAVAVTYAAQAPESAQSMPVAKTDGAYARWLLPETGLRQGETVIELAADTWKASLYRLARPRLSGFSPVFFVAEHELEPGKTWPSGPAAYNVVDADGNIRNVGIGQFDVLSRNVVLNFGIDPRVTVKSTEDTKENGEEGVISVDRVWRWKNIFTVENHHDANIRIKVERPLPVIGNKTIKVIGKSSPQAQENRNEKTMFWALDIPANETRKITSETEITVPQNDKTLGFNPVMPE